MYRVVRLHHARITNHVGDKDRRKTSAQPCPGGLIHRHSQSSHCLRMWANAAGHAAALFDPAPRPRWIRSSAKTGGE